MEFNPEVLNIIHPLDRRGQKLDTERLLGEDLATYRNRLLEVNVRRASSTYQGLINGITRELGLAQDYGFTIRLKALFSGTFQSITVSFTLNSMTDTSQVWVVDGLIGLGLNIDGKKFKIIDNTVDTIFVSGDLSKFSNIDGTYTIEAYNPAVIIDGKDLSLYRDFFSVDFVGLDLIIDLRQDVLFFSDLVDRINTSTYFVADSLVEGGSEIFAWLLQRQSSLISVPGEVIPSARSFKFINDSIIESSIRFSEKNIFKTEVDLEDVQAVAGNYYIDYSQGFIIVNGLPSGRGTASYNYTVFPMKVSYSPVVIRNFHDESSVESQFRLRELELYNSLSERFVPESPNPETIETINELLNVSPLSWGE